MSVMWHNGHVITDGPIFAPNDRLRLGDGVFDTMLAVNGKLVNGQAHFQRLQEHANVLRISSSYSIPELMTAAEKILTQNNFTIGRYVVNTLITRGPAPRGLHIPDNPDLQTLIIAAPALTEFPPIHAITATCVRRNEGSPLSNIKSCNYGDNILALAEAKDKGANEAILLNNKGHVACAAFSNIFIVRNGKLLTPPLKDGAMDGLIRRKLIERYKAREKTLKPKDLLRNEGIYLTNSVRGVTPVQTLDARPIAQPSLDIDKNFHLT